ncbi:MAG TPA: hypothetical protein VE871_10950 [Longimicrobium sp.]|nr:hypothetical protein [Longimicrobium sp.]
MDEAVAAMAMVRVLDASLAAVGGLLLVLSWWRAMEWKRHRAFWHPFPASTPIPALAHPAAGTSSRTLAPWSPGPA